MIIKASQRSSGQELAAHLLNDRDNDHIKLHEIKGFLADTLPEAMHEAYAMSRGTRCTQYLFSVSFSPPKDADVSISIFEEAIDRTEKKMGLEDQPRAIIFHEKEGRRHAHAVWSRINTEEMKAINLPHFKNKLMEISKALYLENDWKLPQGFINRDMRNPLNFTHEQWQQANRLGDNPKIIKMALKECWAVSDDKAAFSQALEQKGFYLAKGDRRGFVAVDWRGEVYSLSRWLDVKSKVLKERLGEPAALPSVEETRAGLDQKLVQNVQAHIDVIRKNYRPRLSPLVTQKSYMVERQERERQILAEEQEKRQQAEIRERQARFTKGLRGMWDRMTGKYVRIKKQNEYETYQAFLRDRQEKDRLILRQIEQRRGLQENFDYLRTQQQEEMIKLKETLFSNLPQEKTAQIEPQFDPSISQPEQDFDLEQ